MQTGAETREWTDEALRALPRDGRKHEVIGGALLVSPTGFQHGYIALRLGSAMMNFALEHQLGIVVDSSTGFRMASGDCLSPDVSFVSRERLRDQEQLATGFFQGAPDLVVEVISPGESQTKLAVKLAEYFANGTRVAWLLDPKTSSAKVYTSAVSVTFLGEAESLDGMPVMPGFTVGLKELFCIPKFD